MIFLQGFIKFDQGISEKMDGQNWCGKWNNKNNNNKKWYDLKNHNKAPNSKNDHGYQFARAKYAWKPNFAQIGRNFVISQPFWIQNGRHSKPKWLPYGAACLTPCKYLFPLKSFHFWILNDFLIFYIGSHFDRGPFWKF